jgi:hypothetical protein
MVVSFALEAPLQPAYYSSSHGRGDSGSQGAGMFESGRFEGYEKREVDDNDET